MDNRVTTLEEFESEAARFARGLSPSSERATLVTLSGELGAGKTAFTKAVAKEFGVTDIVNSPTFVLEKIYQLPTARFKRLVHIDAYRLEKGSELGPLELDALMKDPQNLIMLEWPEKVADGLPPRSVSISITTEPDGSRFISYV